MIPTVVSGSKQYRSIVVRYHPYRRALIIVCGIALFFAVSILCFWFGGFSIKKQFQQLKTERIELAELLKASDAEREAISQQLANTKLGADVDRKAINNVQAIVKEYQQTIAELNEEISFYKGLMAPTEREEGLSIRSWNVYATNDPQRFQYKLVAQQLAHKHSLLKGSLDVTILGQAAGKENLQSLSSLSEQAKQHKNIKLRFKYFQNLDGELQLPEGFKPQSVDIVARATTPKSARIERHFGWEIQH